ncbi:MAG: homocitrate synthase, partial [Geovibrio sp.]|nr:homocitrate synthase [Geovibrio sp.]
MKSFIIDDTTLRDGEQTPGVSFTLHEKLEIAKGLDKIGVQEIEAGIPVMGEEESRVFSRIIDLGLNARIIAWNRALISDIQASINAGADSVEISLPLSDIQIKTKLNKDREWVKDQIKRVIDYCVSKKLYVSVGGEDASRADIDFVIEYANLIKEHGGARFRYCDTVGILDPFSTYETVRRIIEEADIDVEIHAHNDFGLATANSLAAIRAGATHVNTTVIGLGERAGNAPLEEIVMASRYVYGVEDGFDHSCIKNLSEYVSKASGRAIEPYRPVIGELMFTHESGIHTDGILKNPNNYEAFDPAELGMERKLVVGKHSGRGIL